MKKLTQQQTQELRAALAKLQLAEGFLAELLTAKHSESTHAILDTGAIAELAMPTLRQQIDRIRQALGEG